MNRKIFIPLLLIVFILSTSGCSLMPKRNKVDYEKQLNEMTAANGDLRQSLAKTNTALLDSEKALADKQAEIARLQEDKTALAEQVKRLTAEAEKGKTAQTAAIAATPSTAKDVNGAVKKQDADATDKAAPGSLRIKVLAGTTQLAKARVLSMRLKSGGYKVEKLDQSRAFDQSIVYYGANLEKDAEAIARYLGKNVETRKITWHSVFNIIVAVGKKP